MENFDYIPWIEVTGYLEPGLSVNIPFMFKRNSTFRSVSPISNIFRILFPLFLPPITVRFDISVHEVRFIFFIVSYECVFFFIALL